MSKKLFMALLCFLAASFVKADGLPKTSTADNPVWYLVQFMNGQNVLSARNDGGKALTAVPTGNDYQLWRVDGTQDAGYSLTNKAGLKLYVNSTAKEGMFYASSAKSANDLFVFQTTTNAQYEGGLMISPKANKNVFMNQWGGAGTGKELGLWDDKASDGQPLKFIKADEFNKGERPLPIIPYPKSLTRGEGNLPLTGITRIAYDSDESQKVAEGLADALKAVCGMEPEMLKIEGERPAQAISFVTDANLSKDAYTLNIDGKGVTISASSFGGFFYAATTLKQLLPAQIFGKARVDAKDWQLPYVEISDSPQMEHRGFMLDVARHFFTKDEIKKLLDVAAIYKLNRFHWHLTDDQGWRIEIPEYPKLTTVGSIRRRSLVLNDPTNGKEFYDDTEYGRGMFFTLDDLKEIVAYAKERNIDIMPEIDMPGHMVAAITAYPEFSCDPTKKYEVRSEKGISTDVLNVGDDKVIDFLKCVLDHIAQVFPFEYIHLGGDECPTTVWVNNADCKRRIQQEGLAGVQDLQPWLVETLGTYLKDKYGKKVVAWNELQDHWKSDYKADLVIMSWTKAPIDAIKKGLKSIYTPSPAFYLDMMQAPVSMLGVNEPYMGGYGDNVISTVQSLYSFNPYAGLSEAQKPMCIGMQGNLWTESCNDAIEAEYQYYPRLLAISETCWLPAEKKNWIGFYQRLQQSVNVLEEKDINYAKHYIETETKPAAEAALDKAQQILNQSHPGEVGYPSKEAYEALSKVVEAQQANPDAEALQQAINAYKASPIALPQENKTYQIVSASTFYRNQYEGATIYAKNGSAYIHYTPQTEPEELWRFIPKGNGGFEIENCMTLKRLELASQGAASTLVDGTATQFVVTTATTATKEYDYLPGVVNISSSKAATGSSAIRLYADMSGQIVANANAALCYPGTWRIVEVTDFTSRLKGLCDKCERIAFNAENGISDPLDQETTYFLQNTLLKPAKAAVEKGGVTEADYNAYVELYKQLVAMTKSAVLNQLDEGFYYRLRNVYHNKYASAVASAKNVTLKALSQNNDSFLWSFKKNDDGTATIYNKLTGTAAYVATDADGQSVKLGKDYPWTLQNVSTAEATGIGIIDRSGAFSWYSNPAAWSYVLLKPYTWGAGVWALEKAEEVETSVGGIVAEDGNKRETYYDLAGRRLSQPNDSGVYVTSSGKVVLER